MAMHDGCGLLSTPQVIFSDGWVLPFFEVLDYSKFAVLIKEADYAKTVEILRAIPDDKVCAMRKEALHHTFRALRWIDLNGESDEFRNYVTVMDMLLTRILLVPDKATDGELRSHPWERPEASSGRPRRGPSPSRAPGSLGCICRGFLSGFLFRAFTRCRSLALAQLD